MLITAGVLLLLAAIGLSVGSLLTPAATFLGVWLGWGIFALVAALGVLGAILIRPPMRGVSWGKVFSLEFAALLILGLLSISGGSSLVRADAGLDGGRLGWGIAYVLTRYLGAVGGYRGSQRTGTRIRGQQVLVSWARLERRLTERGG